MAATSAVGPRFATQVIQEVRANVGPDFPVVIRLSTWKQQDYSARLAANPQEWAAIVRPSRGLASMHSICPNEGIGKVSSARRQISRLGRRS